MPDKDNEINTEAVRMERTGDKEFVVEHEDGSQFHCEADSKERADNIGTGLRKVGSKPQPTKKYFSGLNFDKNGKIIWPKE